MDGIEDEAIEGLLMQAQDHCHTLDLAGTEPGTLGELDDAYEAARVAFRRVWRGGDSCPRYRPGRAPDKRVRVA